MATLLSLQELANVLPYAEAVATLERGFTQFAEGGYDVPQRLIVKFDQGLMAVMPAAGSGVLAVKVATVHGRNAEAGRPTVQATILVLSQKTGELLAVVDGTSLTVIRTAAASAVATKVLASPGPATLGILGAGPLAAGHIRAIAAVRPLRRVRIFSPHIHQRWSSLATSLGDLNLDLAAVSTARDAVRDAQIVVLATTSPSPVLSWEWLLPGAHINAVGSHTPAHRELDTDTVRNGTVICDSVEACWTEAGDLLIPYESGLIGKDRASVALGDVLLGRATGRTSADEVTVFKSVGLAFQDLCTALKAWETAVQQDLGSTWMPGDPGPATT